PDRWGRSVERFHSLRLHQLLRCFCRSYHRRRSGRIGHAAVRLSCRGCRTRTRGILADRSGTRFARPPPAIIQLSGEIMQRLNRILSPAMAMLMAVAPGFTANHREAPITALDHKADITDVFAFRSYDADPTPRVTMILCVDPLLEP